MEELLNIATKNARIPDEMDGEIRGRASKLWKWFDGIVGCRVTVEGPGGHEKRGGYRVRVSLSVPHRKLTVNRQSDGDLSVAVRGAFDAAERGPLDRAAYERDQERVRSDPEMRQILARWRSLLEGPVEMEVLSERPLR